MSTKNLMEKLQKLGHVKEASSLSDSELFNEKDMIQTDIPILNLALSSSIDGGLIPGVGIIAGPQATFKTNMCFKMVSAYLNKYPDSICVFYDCEFGTTPQYIQSLGVDDSRILHIPIKNLEELKLDMVQKLKGIERGDKIIFFLDSLGNLPSVKELTDAQEGKTTTDMSRAREIKSFFRMITPSLTMLNVPFIAIAHVYSEMGLYPKTIISGGCVIENTKVRMSDKTLKNIQDIKEGDIVDTLNGPKPVLVSWDPSTLDEGITDIYDITFDDGTTVSCSPTHKFLSDTFEWIEAEHLTEGRYLIEK